MKQYVIKNNFSAGELAPTLYTRTDIQQYANGAKKLKNVIPLVEGGIRKRPGTYFIEENQNAVRLIPFVVNSNKAYMLILKPQLIQIFDPRLKSVIASIATPYTAQQIQEVQFVQYGFAEVSTAQVGMYFNGGNAFAFKFRYSPSSVVYPTLINTYGFTIKSGKITKSASSGISIDLSAMNWFINNTSSEFTVVLPSNELVTGQELELLIFGVNQVKFKCLNTNIKVNNLDEYLYTPSVTYKKMKAIWNGSGWFIFS